MPSDNPSWIPATPRERVFLFALAIALMLNTTVVMLLVTGDLPVLGDLLDKAQPTAAQADQPEPSEQLDQPETPKPAIVEVAEQPAPAAAPSVGQTPAAATQLSAVPARAAHEPIQPEPRQTAQQAQPQQDDPPVTFFGVGLE